MISLPFSNHKTEFKFELLDKLTLGDIRLYDIDVFLSLSESFSLSSADVGIFAFNSDLVMDTWSPHILTTRICN